MKRKQKKKEKYKKTFKWYLDKILMAIMGIFALMGVMALLSSADSDGTELMFSGIAILLLTGLLMSPNILLYAVKEGKDWESRVFKYKQGKSFRNKLYQEDFFRKVADPSPYHNKIVHGVIREAVWSLGGLIVLITYILFRNIISFLFGYSRRRSKAFVYISAIIIFLIPMFAYNVTCSIHRIRTVLRREYFVCHAVVSGVKCFNMRITGKKGDIYQFKYCRCLGVRERDVHDSKVILAFVPDEVYLLPDNE